MRGNTRLSEAKQTSVGQAFEAQMLKISATSADHVLHSSSSHCVPSSRQLTPLFIRSRLRQFAIGSRYVGLFSKRSPHGSLDDLVWSYESPGTKHYDTAASQISAAPLSHRALDINTCSQARFRLGKPFVLYLHGAIVEKLPTSGRCDSLLSLAPLFDFVPRMSQLGW